MSNQPPVTDKNSPYGAAIQNGNITQALLDDLQERGYKLSVNERGRLCTDPNGPPITPVIWHALQANYGKLVRLLSPPVTDTDSRADVRIKKDNTDWSKVKDLRPKRGEEMNQAVAEYRAAIEHTKAVVSAANPKDFFEGLMMHSREMDKHKPGRDCEAERRIEASKQGGVCGKCGEKLADGESAYLAEHVYAGMWGSLTPRPGPRYDRATVCAECAPDHMTEPLESSFDTQVDAGGGTERTHYNRNVAQMPCPTCERPVVFKRTARWRPRVFCSHRCQYTYNNRRRSKRRQRLREKVCEVCGEEFTATRTHAKTCSAACKQKAYRRRQQKEAV